MVNLPFNLHLQFFNVRARRSPSNIMTADRSSVNGWFVIAGSSGFLWFLTREEGKHLRLILLVVNQKLASSQCYLRSEAEQEWHSTCMYWNSCSNKSWGVQLHEEYRIILQVYYNFVFLLFSINMDWVLPFRKFWLQKRKKETAARVLASDEFTRYFILFEISVRARRGNRTHSIESKLYPQISFGLSRISFNDASTHLAPIVLIDVVCSQPWVCH